MSSKHKFLPAVFPIAFTNNQDVNVDYFGENIYPGETIHHTGMSLRDYFAAQAMQGFIAGPENFSMGDSHNEKMEVAAKCFYMMADAMLKARGE